MDKKIATKKMEQKTNSQTLDKKMERKGNTNYNMMVPIKYINSRFSDYYVCGKKKDYEEIIELCESRTKKQLKKMENDLIYNIEKWDNKTLDLMYKNKTKTYKEWCDDCICLYALRNVLYNQPIKLVDIDDDEINKEVKQLRKRKRQDLTSIEYFKKNGSSYIGIIDHNKKTSCLICNKPTKFKCSGCKCVSYCSKECQTKHWKEHKSTCKIIQNQKQNK